MHLEQFLYLGQVPINPNWSMDWHQHIHHECIIVMAGILHVEIGNEQIHAQTGNILHYPATVAHKEHSDNNKPCDICYLSWHGETPEHMPTVVNDQTGRMRTLVSWCLNDANSVDANLQLQQEYIALFFAEYKKAIASEQSASDIVQESILYMQQHLSAVIQVDHLAEHVGMSRSHYIRQFKKIRGITPMEELRKQRVEHARRLIMSSNDTLESIAHQVGFANAFHLSRLFKKTHGVAPGAMRRARRSTP